MINRIIDDQIRTNLDHLFIINSLIDDIGSFPTSYLLEMISKNKKIGSRNFMWCIQAMNSLAKDPEIGFIPNGDDLTRITNYTISNYTLEQARGLKILFESSQFSAITTLEKIVEIYGHEETIETYTSFAKKFKKEVKRQILNTLKTMNISDYLKWYEISWSLDALFENNSDIKDLDFYGDLADFGIKGLERHIAYFASNVSAFNKIELAIATMFAWYDYFESDRILDGNFSKLIEMSAKICLENSDGYLTKRLIYRDEDLGELHNLPWEEVFIITGLPEKYLPVDLKIVLKICDFINKRKVAAFSNSTGLSEESYEKFPEAAPYFSNYSIVLLTRIKMLLKSRLRKDFINQIVEIDSSYIIDPMQKKIISFDEMFDTFENTGKYILSKLPKSQSNFQGNLKSFNTMLIFGPPGTGKSTLLEALVKYFQDKQFVSSPTMHKETSKWIGITLTPSMFLVDDSFTEVLKNAEEIISVILNLDHCVFLFDEAEELAIDRNEEIERFGRMFTAAMLLHLNRLKNGKSIYVLATNYINKMDKAAIRKGRFAIRKGIGWINESELERIVEKFFENHKTAIKARLLKNLSQRTIGEIIDIQKSLKLLGTDNKLNYKDIDNFFNNWKNYLSEELIDDHTKNCEIYDDSYK